MEEQIKKKESFCGRNHSVASISKRKKQRTHVLPLLGMEWGGRKLITIISSPPLNRSIYSKIDKISAFFLFYSITGPFLRNVIDFFRTIDANLVKNKREKKSVF